MEAVALGEVTGARADELRAHAAGCSLCRHELRWLESEAALFRERAGRETVAHLWAGVAQRRGLEAPRAWPRVLAAVAAGVVLLLAASRVVPVRAGDAALAQAASEETLESPLLMSPVLFAGGDANCSRLPLGVGFRCEPVVPASFLASR
jgi:hypothetical protein